MKRSARLSEIASIRTGYTFRGKIEGSENGTVSVIQPRDIENEVLESIPTKVEQNQFKGSFEAHLLQHGDLLLPNKGIRFSTFRYQGEPEDCIASSSFFVISPIKEIVHPEYLQWMLSQPGPMDYLVSSLSGSTIPTITKKSLEGLEISLVNLPAQNKIIEVIQLVNKEKMLLETLIKKRGEFKNSFCWEIIQSA